MIPVNSIKIPEQFVEAGSRWWGSIDDALYALARGNGICIDGVCPVTVYIDVDERDRKWYLTAWRSLLNDMVNAIDRIIKHCKHYEHEFNTDSPNYALACEDLKYMCLFAEWSVEQVRALEDSYNLRDWRI